MGLTEKINSKIYEKFKDQGISKKTFKKISYYNYKFWTFVWMIARSILFIYFAQKGLEKYGFEKMAITLLVMVNMVFWGMMKQRNNPFK